MIEIVKKINPILEKYMEENSIEVLLKKKVSIYQKIIMILQNKY